MKKRIPFCLLVLTTMVQLSCAGQADRTASPPGYDLGSPKVINLPKAVDQISGITYNPSDQSVFAIDDDHGNLYKIPLREAPQIEHWPFGKAHDYEDVVMSDNRFFVLNSKGKIVSFATTIPPDSTTSADLGQKGRNEFESLFKDPSSPRLLILCKECGDDGKGKNSLYAFDLKTLEFLEHPIAELVTKDIEDIYGKQIGKFKPSAANVNPLTGEVYIISSVNKLLVVATPGMKVKTVYGLDAKRFKQPEGLCFTPSGDLLISNEAAGQGNANILIFAHSK